MDNFIRVDGVNCSICLDSKKCEIIHLTCGHAFGRSCLLNRLESHNQKTCTLCHKQLTDNDIKEIKAIPLPERLVIISKKMIKLFWPSYFDE
ncbi:MULTISPECIES: RING finger domain-containing protein [Gammaproteobacteria]|uniref:RING finger domain-containing protein n=1 Tax=Gammaproteobacteria TaxID=1236 RepID=UPI001ADD56DD|nr:hypothetical protein [Salinisphaera sp. G21_0]MBO9492773.1 hypothetical protein [Thalassotalea sp. G20_0]